MWLNAPCGQVPSLWRPPTPKAQSHAGTHSHAPENKHKPLSCSQESPRRRATVTPGKQNSNCGPARLSHPPTKCGQKTNKCNIANPRATETWKESLPCETWRCPDRRSRGNVSNPNLNYETKPIRSFVFNKSSLRKPNSADDCPAAFEPMKTPASIPVRQNATKCHRMLRETAFSTTVAGVSPHHPPPITHPHLATIIL